MNFKNLFLNPHNTLESGGKAPIRKVTCRECKRETSFIKVRMNNYICPMCNSYFPIRARRRIIMIFDKRSFVEIDREMTSKNILDFPGYDKKLEGAIKKSRELEGVICGYGTINKQKCAVFSMDPYFMMGSMGAIVGEKITRLFEYATENSMPVVGITVSGGARMQEGMISLMQMSKVSAAVKKHSDKGNLYIALLTNPTTGGVNASFAMLSDIAIAEPNARIGFAGPRVIKESLGVDLPKDFQMSERVLECGFIDKIVNRENLKEELSTILKLHDRGVIDGRL